MGVTEMGRKSDRLTGCVTFDTGDTTAVNHDDGTVLHRNEQLKISVTTSEQYRKTQDGVLSKPGEVFFTRRKRSSTSTAVIYG